MRNILFASVAFLAAASAFSEAGSLTLGGEYFPASVAGAPWVQVTNFAADGGPGGIGASYRSSDFKADIYLFDAGDPSWIGKSLDERFVLEATGMFGVLKEIERRGIYSDLKILGANDAKAGPLSFTHFRATYTEKGERKKSHYYLAKYRNRLLKVRITGAEQLQDTVLQKAFDESVALFAKNAGH